MTNLSPFALDFPSFSTESNVAQETCSPGQVGQFIGCRTGSPWILISSFAQWDHMTYYISVSFKILKR